MGAIYMILSSLLFVLEIVLQIRTIAWYSNSSQAVFITLLALVMGPLIIVNFISAILVTRTQEFAEKRCGRAICISFHVLQLGMVWRSLKLLILYDGKDWLEYLNLRLVHCGFQSLPFSVVVAYNLFVNNQSEAVQIVCIVVSLSSTSLSLTIYRLGTVVYQSEEFETLARKISSTGGVVLLFASTVLMLLSRCTSIVLFTLVQPYWIILPLGLHFIIYLLSGLIRQTCGHNVSFISVVRTFHMSFLNIFDLVGRDYKGVKCTYVLFYAAMLIENIIMSASWMLTANYGDSFKLMTIICVMVSFIVGIIGKYTGCGCIYDIEPDIMSDAFSNPELKTVLGIESKNHVDQNGDVIRPTPRVDINHEPPITSMNYKHSHIASVTPTSQSSSSADTNRNPSHSSGEKITPRLNSSGETSRPRHDSMAKSDRPSVDSSASTSKRIRQYDNRAFEKSQRSISEGRQTYNSVDDTSRSQNVLQPNTLHVTDNDSKLRYGLEPKVTQVSNDELALSTSRLSRNTHTLKSSQLQYNNGFNDPFREQTKPQTRRKRVTAQERLYSDQNKIDVTSIKRMLQTPSLDTSDLYPYVSSDTSSSIYYANTKSRQWYRQRPMSRSYQTKPNDGYSTDVSNSDYLSLNDYSLDDSSSWTETSDSDYALTWPPSHTANLLKGYGISDKVSSEENILHWLDMVDQDEYNSDSSFSTLMHNVSIPDDATDISMSALQKFEVKTKQDKKTFKSFIPTPKGIFIKFRSLNYKGKQKPHFESQVVPGSQTSSNKPANGNIHTDATVVAEAHLGNKSHTRTIPFNDRSMSQPYVNHRHPNAKQPFEVKPVSQLTPHSSMSKDRTSPFEKHIASLKQYNNTYTQGKQIATNSRLSEPKDTSIRELRDGSDMNTSTDTYTRSNINEKHINAKYRQGTSASTQYCNNRSIDINDPHSMQHRLSPYTDTRHTPNVQVKHVFTNHTDHTRHPPSFGNHSSLPSISPTMQTRVQESIV